MTRRAVRALFAGVVDYAGLFPPSALSLDAAAAEYARALASPEAWLLNRFVAPAARLADLARTGAWAASERPWRISALVGEDVAADLAAVAVLDAGGRGRVESVELKASSPSGIEQALAALPLGLEAYVELPLDGDTDALLAAVLSRAGRAKVRTGGLAPAAIPSAASLARFVAACARRGVALKATAGLHHAVRSEHALHDGATAPRALLHGFVNLFAAAAFARQGASAEELESVLLEQDPAAFALDDEALCWRYLRAPLALLEQARAALAVSFGSCSFAEPVAELRALGLLA